MKVTTAQKMRIERLYENESLTDNLVDRDAQGLLKWAETQILANTDSDLVTAAVRAANTSGISGAQALIARASTFLAQKINPNQAAPQPSPNTSDAPTPTPTPEPHAAPADREAKPNSTPQGVLPSASAEAAPEQTIQATADAQVAPPTPPAPTSPKKSRRSTKRQSKAN